MSEQTKFAALDDLRSVVRIAKAASLGVTGNTPRIERAEKAIAGVAELVEADVEYDAAADAVAEAKRAKGNWRINPLGHLHPAVVRMRAAKARRAAALAAVRGGAKP